MSDTQPTKLGLALSGGGFRASLFHIGVLAALAEREMLHKVETISTVSGGSIIGAYYYLKVKRLLEGNRPDFPTPTPAAYRQIVAEIERDFLEAVQKNIRLRLFLNPWKNALMLNEDYSRSDHLAELLNKYFYNEAGGETDIALRNIHIHPAGTPIKATDHNAVNEFKIPVLVLNATCLNTGHAWHFTGAYVGEPEPLRGFVRENDGGYRLPILRFDGEDPPPLDEWPLPYKRQDKLNDLKLADAVAASAAVPAIFPPFSIHDLYKNRDNKDIVVELCDGGVFDNQGVGALYSQHCTHFVISDAAGQIDDQDILGIKAYQVALRSNDVMMSKIRYETLYRVVSGNKLEQVACAANDPAATTLREENGVQGYALAHTRQAFTGKPDYPNLPGPADRSEGMIYRLSCIRTDLDAFSDAEAYSLMYDGYNLAHEQLAQQLNPLSAPDWQRLNTWRFLAIRASLLDNRRLDWLNKRLLVGARQFFRPFFLTPMCAFVCSLFVLIPLALILVLTYGHFAEVVVVQGPVTVHELLYAIGTVAIGALLNMGGVGNMLKNIPFTRNLRLFGGQQFLVVLSLAGTLLLSLAMLIYLSLFNPMFLNDGKIEDEEPPAR